VLSELPGPSSWSQGGEARERRHKGKSGRKKKVRNRGRIGEGRERRKSRGEGKARKKENERSIGQ